MADNASCLVVVPRLQAPGRSTVLRLVSRHRHRLYVQDCPVAHRHRVPAAAAKKNNHRRPDRVLPCWAYPNVRPE